MGSVGRVEQCAGELMDSRVCSTPLGAPMRRAQQGCVGDLDLTHIWSKSARSFVGVSGTRDGKASIQ